MLNRDVNAAMIMAITSFIGASDKPRIEWMTQGQRTSSLWLADLLQKKGLFHYGGNQWPVLKWKKKKQNKKKLMKI